MTTVRGEELEVDGKVSEVAVNFRVLEDGALAYQLQEEEYAGHYSGNITRNRTVRQDIRTAKEVADEEALQAFREEHEQVEKNREMEERDRKAAKKLYLQMMEEEKKKMYKQRSVEDEDQDIARRLQEHEKKKAALVRQQQNASIEETDEEIAKRLQEHEAKKAALKRQRSKARMEENDQDIVKRLQEHEAKKAALKKQRSKARMEEYDQDMAKRLQAHEERKAAILRQKQHEKDAALARQISQTERPKLPETPRSPGADINGVDRATASLSLHEEGLPVYPAPLPPKQNRHSAPVSPTYDPNYEIPMEARKRGEVETMVFDDDDRTDIEAKEADDAEIARRLQREEIKKSRRNKAKPELSDDELKRLQHDERIARKMQHEEVMIAKNKYHRYKERVDDEIASPEPMTHVSRSNKTVVTTDAKYDQGITLTDYKPGEGALLRKPSVDSDQRTNGGPVNIAAAIDPTYSTPDAGNVVLMHHRRSLNEGPPPGSAPGELNKIETEADENIAPVQGSRRKKETKKKSIFSKLKKK